MLFTGGSYVIVTSSRSSGGRAVLVSPPVSAVRGDRRCLDFWWSTNLLSSAGVLSVRVLRHDGVLLSEAWNQSNTVTRGAWTQATISLRAEGPFQVSVCSVSLVELLSFCQGTS